MVKKIIGKLFYGVLFVVLLPLFLIFWASRVDNLVYLPAIQAQSMAFAVMIFGGFIIAKGMLDLAVYGKGLPMNAYPPKNLVDDGIYAWFSHPIYFGAGLLAFGAALWYGSPAGLYIVAPVLALAMVSLVIGYERPALVRIFGTAAEQYRPVFSMPVGPARSRKLFIGLGIFLLAALYFSALLYLFNFDFGANWQYLAAGAAVIFVLSLSYASIWRGLKNFSQWVANSRKDYLFFGGKFRIINHALYSGPAGFVAVGIAGFIIGNSLAVIVLALCAIIGGALFAQLRWGSPSLLRPYGFWGGIIGGIIGMIAINILFGVPIYQTMLAAALAVPPAQAIGRLRCLAQGCCHGIVTDEASGIRVWQPQSRVVMLSGLKGQYIHVTQLYSILFNLWLASLLFSMWLSNRFAAALVIGMYLILTGIERFTEDSYRGEKQTRMARGMQENQWIAVIALLTGMFVALLPFPVSIPALGNFDLGLLATALAGGLLSAFSMSMDFPKSNIRYSRLSG